MADQAPSFTAPADFHPLDKRVAASGAPLSGWLGQDLVLRDRWMLKHCRRSFSIPIFPRQTARALNGEILGPYFAVGTANAREAEWRLSATVAYGESAIAAPVVLEPSILAPRRVGRWAYTLVGTGSEEIYTIPAPHTPGASVVGLVLYGQEGSGAATVGGDVFLCRDNKLDTTDSVLSIVPPGWVVRILDSTGTQPLTDWLDVLDASHFTTGTPPDYLHFFPPLQHNTVFTESMKCQWEAKEIAGQVEIGGIGWREVPT